METALLSSVARGVSLVQALIDLGPDAGRAVLRELSALPAPTVHFVKLDPVLVRRLPAGLCERLLAAPLSIDGASSITICAVDPLETHVEQEFSFHLNARVRVVRAAYADLVTALDMLKDAARGHARAPSPALYNEPLKGGGGTPSSPPIPLVRRQPGSATAPSPRPPLGPARTRILAASNPPELIDALLHALAAEAKKVLLLAVKEGSFEGLRSNLERAAGAADVRSLRSAVGEPSVLQSALTAGYYLGGLKQAPFDRAIAATLELGADEVYALPVFVSGRAALMVVAGGLEGTLETTRRIDELSRDAGAQLEQIVRSRKRSS